MCSGCRGLHGKRPLPNVPALQGKAAATLERALCDFRAGRRANPVTQSIARPLSEANTQALATCFSSRD
jgi:cytochrome c553